MSWAERCHGAGPPGWRPFPPGSPFAGLAVPADVTVSRQVLAEPSASLAAHTWARLADGTPLVTEAARGRGRVVLFHVTANADWSNLPLSGLFVDMLRRLVTLSAGVAAPPTGKTLLAPMQTLDGYGLLWPAAGRRQRAGGRCVRQHGRSRRAIRRAFMGRNGRAAPSTWPPPCRRRRPRR